MANDLSNPAPAPPPAGVTPEQRFAFDMKEYEALRDEIRSRIEDVFKLELATLGAVLASTAWLMQYSPASTALFAVPLVIWVIGGFAILSKSHHLNRLSNYIILHYEDRYGHQLWSGRTIRLTTRRFSILDQWSGKVGQPVRGTPAAVQNLEGGWESWFEQQSYNYTWFQIIVWVLVFLVSGGIMISRAKGWL